MTPDGALAKYESEKADLHAGRTPRPAQDEDVTVFRVTGEFLTSKERKRDSEELSPRTYRDYDEVCKLLCKSFGRTHLVSDIAPDDFSKLRAKLAKRLGPVRLGNVVQRIVPCSVGRKRPS